MAADVLELEPDTRIWPILQQQELAGSTGVRGVDYAAARFAALALLAFAKFASNAAFLARDIFFFAGAVFAGAVAGASDFFDSAHRFR